MTRRLVLRELLFTVAGAMTGGILLLGSATPFAGWRIGVVAVLVTTPMLAAADRLDGWRVAAPLSLFALLAVAFLVLRYPPDPEAVGAGIVGVNAGWALNRLVFGIARDVPEPRLRRERA
ncbi:hypothetical protein B4589_013730 [Halolamina sp. CBA1230]|uniref:hypothetical protein n=1 Tax=Halolamina sp. CBA1230 TaxID=1853690 RepID=UPI0009A23AC1|nr:hypothetical protein [Halolamina sp. CBA1230]QKY21380.1 hypothetical protein B4589_013730 [Halolamina sp. CBA1230]